MVANSTFTIQRPNAKAPGRLLRPVINNVERLLSEPANFRFGSI